ncbi:MAG: DMT family transporter [Alphaproteobacteria bacterium]
MNSLPQAHAHNSANAAGAMWIVASCLAFAAQAVCVKLLGRDLDSFQIVFLRCVLTGLFVLPLAIRAGGIRTSRPGMHIMRGLLGVTAMACTYYAITKLPLADVTAINFSKAMFTVVTAAILLGEVVGWRRWTATGLGFLGVLIMIRPGFATVEFATLVALAAAFLAGFIVTLLKKLSTTEKSITIMFYFGVCGSIATAPMAIYVWQPMSWAMIGLTLLAAIVGTFAQWAAIKGWSRGDTASLAPFSYTQLIFAAVLGYIVFLEIPDEWTVVGALVIAGSALYIGQREARLRRQAAAQAQPAAE